MKPPKAATTGKPKRPQRIKAPSREDIDPTASLVSPSAEDIWDLVERPSCSSDPQPCHFTLQDSNLLQCAEALLKTLCVTCPQPRGNTVVHISNGLEQLLNEPRSNWLLQPCTMLVNAAEVTVSEMSEGYRDGQRQWEVSLQVAMNSKQKSVWQQTFTAVPMVAADDVKPRYIVYSPCLQPQDMSKQS